MTKIVSKCIVLSTFIWLISCSMTPKIDNATMLDGGKINEPSIVNPADYLISQQKSTPNKHLINKAVVIAIHGYSATTFEWDEFRKFANADSSVLVSQVLLGGHGRSYEAFKSAKWQDWQQPIIDEYRKLDSLGYTNIYLVGSSAAAPLIINAIKNNLLPRSNAPKGIFFIDPFIISINKFLYVSKILGPILSYTKIELTDGEKGKWYVYRPQESLNELRELITLTCEDLEQGVTLPEKTFLKAYISTGDDVANPEGEKLIRNGIKTSNGKAVEVEMIDSKLHVFTRLAGRDNINKQDSTTQKRVFNEIKSRIARKL